MKRIDRILTVLGFLLLTLQCGMVRAQVNVTTYHNDNARTGQFTQETTLNPSNVNSSQFGRLFTINVDGYVYAQPLYLSNVVINGGTHNVLYVATEHDSLYAIDADSGLVYWAISLIASGGTTVSSSSDLGCGDLVPEVGITGTPVIDSATNTIYLVAKSKVSGTIVQYLHAIDAVTGADKFGGPTLIQATAAGTAGDGNGSTVTFNAKWENQRVGLLLDSGHVIIGWSAHCDISPWHGWVMSYGASSLAQEAALNTSPNGYGNGVWMSGDGIAADAAGNIYFATGNGSWNGTTDLANSIVKLGLPSGHAFPILDYFTPYDQVSLTNNDLDVASGGLLLLPPLAGGKQLLVQQSKVGKIFVIDTASMGKYCVNLTPACTSSDTNIVQEIPGATTGIWGAPGYWNGSVYWSGGNDNDGSTDSIKAFSFNAGGSGLLSTTPTSQSTAKFGFSSPIPSISSNGTLDGIMWGLDNSHLGSCGGTVNCQALYAYDATNLQTMLYNSNQAAGFRDVPGGAVKFTTPIVANGKVFFGSQSSASAFGLLATAPVTAKPTFSPAAGTYSAAQAVTIADATPGATILYTLDGTYPTVTSATYTGPIQVTGTTTIHAVAIAAGAVTSPMANGTYTITAPAAAAPAFSPSPGTYSATQSVTLSDSTPGAVIRYTTDGTTPNTTTSPTYNGPIQVTVTTTIKALAYAAGFSNSSVVTGTYTITAPPPPAAATPTFSLAAGAYSSTQSISISDATVGATIYYTTDGSTPNPATSAVYSAPVQVSAPTTLSAIAAAPGYSNSAVASRTYNVILPLTTYGIPLTGVANVYAVVSDGSAVPGTGVDGGGHAYSYVLLGPTPAWAGNTYNIAPPGSPNGATSTTVPLPPGQFTTLSMLAAGYNGAQLGQSFVVNYTDSTTSVFTQSLSDWHSPQGYAGESNAFPNAYRVNPDGSLFNSTYYLYGYSFTLDPTRTAQSLTLPANANVVVVAVDATSTGAAAAPTFSPSPGTYASTQNVTLSDATAGAAIHYTTDGSTPTSASTLYAGSIAVAATTTIKAIAVASGYTDSAVATGTYTITALPVAATPTASPPPGTYAGTQAVSLSDSTPGALIYYTLDGSTPTTASSLYVNGTPLQISSTTTIKAIAVASGYTNSAVASGTYTITALPVAATPTASPPPGTYAGTQAVSLSDSTPGALIYYTLDGSTPTTASSLYVSGTPLQISSTTTIKAIAVASGYTNSAVASGTYTITALPVAATPTFSPVPGTYVGSQSVSLNDSTPGAAIYYTLDGSTPTTSSSLYVSGTPLQISSTTTIKAIAVASGYTNSAVASGTYTITALPVAATPTFSPVPGTYVGSQSVSLNDSTPGALIYYTLDGSTPTTASSLYVSGTPLQISSTTTISAIAVASGYTNSAVASGTYTITALPVAATPTFSPVPGTYVGSQSVSLNDSTPGAAIYYTLDGSTPTSASTLYTGSIAVAATTTIKAIAVASGYTNSAVATGTYTITALPVSATPTASPPPGTYVGTQAVSLSDSTPGALIYYTLDGSTPTTASSLYVSGTPLQISSTTTISAIAVASGYTNSAIATGTYTITALPVAATPTASPPPGTYVGTQAVSLSDSTPGALIYYTLDGSTPTTASSLYVSGTPLQISSTTTISAIAVASGYTNSAIATGTYSITATPTAATPTFSPVPGPYSSAQKVTLTDTTPGAVIYYTTDGSAPTPASAQYVSGTPLQVDATTTINAIAVASGYNDSPLAAGTFTIVAPFTATVVDLTPVAGLYAIVNDGSPVPGAGIDGSGHAYSATLLGPSPAWGDLTFTLGTPGTPNGVSNTTIPLPAGSYLGLYMLATAVNGNQSGQSFVVDYADGTSATFTQGLSDWRTPQEFAGEFVAFSNPYEINPDGSSAAGINDLYGYYFALDGARAVKDLVLPPNGNVVVLAVDLTAPIPAAAPTFSPPPGSYASAQSVAISDGTPGASIYYTVDGSTPSATSSKYAAGTPIAIGATTTLRAIAMAPGYANSTIASGTYTITLPVAAAPTFSPAPGIYSSAQSVSLTDATSGATIHYTTDGTTPTGTSTPYAGPIAVSGTTTIKAIAIVSGYSDSTVATGTYTISVPPPAATPTFTPAPGAYAAAQSVSLADTTPGAAIHYTTDGSTPTSASAVYAAALQISSTTTIQAIAVAPGYTNSSVAVGTYTINAQPVTATPAFSPSPGSFTSPTTVTVVDATVGAVVYYTTDGSTPTASSSVYTAPLLVSATTTITMVALAPGYAASPIVSGTFVISGPTAAATPTFSVPAGTYPSAQLVALSDTTPGSIIHFTTDGTPPSANSPVYSAPLQVSATTTISAIAIASGYTTSAVASATYVISQQAAAPTFSPPPGTYNAVQTVVISDATPGATIHYTLDGSTPTTGSPVYSSPLQVATTTTISAIAVAPGFAASTVASATYTDIRASGGGGGGGSMDWATLAGCLGMLLCMVRRARMTPDARRG